MSEKGKEQETKGFRLSSKGLAFVARREMKKDFTFLVGRVPPFREYSVNSFFANFISPKVALTHASDPSISSFQVPIEDESNSFQLIIDLLYGKKIEPSDIERIFIREVAKILGNDELYCKFADSSQLKITNAIPQMEEKYKNEMDTELEVSFIAGNLASYKAKDFANTPKILLERIFTSDKLLVEDENEFTKFVIEIIESRDKSFVSLFSFLVFENLNKECLTKVLSIIKPEDITTQMWNAIKNRLMGHVKRVVEAGDRYSRNIVICERKDDGSDGIFAMLNAKYGGNPVDKDAISVTCLGETNQAKAKVLFDGNKSNNWGITEKKGNYLLIDFKTNSVRINGYFIRSGSTSHWDYEQSWAIEGSNDGKEWGMIDNKPPNKEMGGNERFHYWQCPQSPEYHMIRWTLLKDGTGTLFSRQFELYGYYIISKESSEPDYQEEEDLSDASSMTFPFMSDK